MITLGIDTSATMISVALADNKTLLGEFFAHSHQNHSASLLPMINALLRHCGLAIPEIDRFCVTQGPGSFTGLRIGVSTAKGLATAQDKPCAGVSTLAAMAAGASMLQGTLCCAMDARREQVYAALFRNGQRLTEDKALPITELEQTLEGPVWFLGDGATLCHNIMQQRPDWLLAPEQLRFQRAYGAILAAEEKDYRSATNLRATYLRPSQAERLRNEASARKPPAP